MNQITPSPKALELARRVLRIEANAVAALVDRADALLQRRPAPMAVVRQLVPAAQAMLDWLAEGGAR